MLSEYTAEELSDGLDCVAREVLCEGAIAGPPIDAVQLARRLNIALAWDDQQQGRARYVRLGGHRPASDRPTILLRPDPRQERRHWAVAHEIGEHVAYRVFARWGEDPRTAPPGAREQVANQLAGRLLLPTSWFAADGAACEWDLIELKSRYRTASHELIARRMLECRPAVVISIFDQGRISFRRSNLPGRVPPPLPGEMKCWRTIREECRPQQSRHGPALIQGWPIYEEQWKREILRMELADAEEQAFVD
ncbi:MAG: ImmA/IrrE family metallo-endopeptidase [Thermoguttaceae bacterium]